MSLDVWFPNDVTRILDAAAVSMEATARTGEIPPAFVEGFRAAVQAIAAGFGLSPLPARPLTRVYPPALPAPFHYIEDG